MVFYSGLKWAKMELAYQCCTTGRIEARLEANGGLFLEAEWRPTVAVAAFELQRFEGKTSSIGLQMPPVPDQEKTKG